MPFELFQRYHALVDQRVVEEQQNAMDYLDFLSSRLARPTMKKKMTTCNLQLHNEGVSRQLCSPDTLHQVIEVHVLQTCQLQNELSA